MRFGRTAVVVAGVAAAMALVAGATAAITWAVVYRVGGPTTSRAAADRKCEREYVKVAENAAGTTLPRLDLVEAVVADPALPGGLEQPTSLAFWPPDPTIAVVGDRVGKLHMLHDGALVPGGAVVDITIDTAQKGDAGLITVTYSPDGQWLYVWRALGTLDDELLAYPTDDDGVPQADGERQILFIDHPPSDQHHGGGLTFGPDGYLYIGTGDGGGLGDPRENGQRLSTLLGKLLRIDPTPEADAAYRIPPDNPFVDRGDARPEVFAYGLRNPFRIAFDRDSGDLWLPDVGHSCWEEVNLVPAGEGAGWNFGWDVREGTHPFEGNAHGDYVEPIYEYAHVGGNCVIASGYRYRGRDIEGLDGGFLFGDYCGGGLRVLFYEADGTRRVESLGIDIEHPVGIVEDQDGEPWVMSLDGAVFRLVPEPSDG